MPHRSHNEIIRPAAPADRKDWLKMRSQLWPRHDTHEADVDHYFSRTHANSGRAWLAFRDGECAGFIEATLRDYAEGCSSSPVCYVEGWFVRKPFHQSGIGRALIETVEAWAISQGISEIASDCEIDNEVSTTAHKRCGFNEVSRIINFTKKLP